MPTRIAAPAIVGLLLLSACSTSRTPTGGSAQPDLSAISSTDLAGDSSSPADLSEPDLSEPRDLSLRPDLSLLCDAGFPCNNRCVDYNTDTNNCGGCGARCNTSHATPECVATSCRIKTCEVNYADCDTWAANGCEVYLRDDPKHCGDCASVCPSDTPYCVSGACVAGCANNTADCNTDPSDACEASLFWDSLNCGACGTACPNGWSCSRGNCTDRPID